MQNITYFTGAGASYHCLPLVRTMNARMVAYSRFLKNQKQNGKLTHAFAETFIKELDSFIQITRDRTSIDAHARELSISNAGDSKTRLRILKAILSSYIIFEQLLKPADLVFYSEDTDHSVVPAFQVAYKPEFQELLKTHIDKRYITFWGEYLTPTGDRLNDNLKILSWNYDMQFEASYSHIKNYSLELAQQNLQIFPSTLRNVDISKSCILKLNGTAGLVGESGRQDLINAFDLREHKLIDNLNYLIDLVKNNYERAFNKPIFSFAWEDEPVVRQTRQFAKDVIKDTSILIVIGYSFPTLNRQVDREIFRDISSLQKVYLQVPKDELPEILDRLDGINPELRDRVIPRHNLDTFYIPTEI